MVNQDVPMFEAVYGQTDYGWLVEVTKNRVCVEVKPCVMRSVRKDNLSLDPRYRLRDYMIVKSSLEANNDKKGIKRLNGSRARYFYKAHQAKKARRYFLQSGLTWKNVLYWITSFSLPMRKFIIKKWNVSG